MVNICSHWVNIFSQVQGTFLASGLKQYDVSLYVGVSY